MSTAEDQTDNTIVSGMEDRPPSTTLSTASGTTAIDPYQTIFINIAALSNDEGHQETYARYRKESHDSEKSLELTVQEIHKNRLTGGLPTGTSLGEEDYQNMLEKAIKKQAPRWEKVWARRQETSASRNTQTKDETTRCITRCGG